MEAETDRLFPLTIPCWQDARGAPPTVFSTIMPADFLTRIKQSPVLCDGAMGTLLYAKGVFINRCYDDLNLSQPDLIRAPARFISFTLSAKLCRAKRNELAPKVLVSIIS